jgi:hypothetical protein
VSENQGVMPEIVGPWVKPGRSNTLNNQGCANLAPTSDGGIALRSDKQTGGPTVFLDGTEFAALLAGVRDGDFDHLLTVTL